MAIPYQSPYSYQPRFGFRYSGSDFAPPTSPINSPNYTMEVPEYKAPAKPIPAASNSTVMGSDNDSDNGSAQESNQLSIDRANQNIGQLNLEEEQPENTGMFSPSPSVTDFIPFSGLFSNEPAVPKSGFGSQGSYSSRTGGQFKDGRSYDPITKYANNEYANQNSFLQGNYMSNILNDPFSDPDNAFKYDRSPNAAMQDVQFSQAKGADTNTPEYKQKVLTNRGIPLSSLQGDDNPTMAATNINNYTTGSSGSLAAPIGSQYSITGTFNTGSKSQAELDAEADAKADREQKARNQDIIAANAYSDNSSSSNAVNSPTGTSVSTSKASYADDAAASNSGGGGGK